MPKLRHCRELHRTGKTSVDLLGEKMPDPTARPVHEFHFVNVAMLRLHGFVKDDPRHGIGSTVIGI